MSRVLFLALFHSSVAYAGFAGQGAPPPPGSALVDEPLTLWAGRRLAPGSLAADLLLEGADDPLVKYVATDSSATPVRTPVVSGFVGARAGFRAALGKRLEISASLPMLPITWLEGAPKGPNFGDLVLAAPVGVVPGGPATLSVVPWVTLPTGRSTLYLGDRRPGGGGLAAFTAAAGPTNITANLGVDLRFFDEEANVVPGAGLVGGAALGVRASERAAASLEWRFHQRLQGVDLGQGFEAPDAAHGSELFLTGKTRLASWTLAAGAGTATQPGFAAARFRAYLGLSRSWGGEEQVVEDPSEADPRAFTVLGMDGSPVFGATARVDGAVVATSDAGGLLRVPKLRPAEEVQVEAFGYQDVVVRLRDGSEITLTPTPAPYRVRVSDEEGRPITGEVRWTRDGVSAGRSPTDARGAELALPPGAWTVEVSAPGYGTQSRALEVPLGGPGGAFEVILLPVAGEGVVALSVLGAEGQRLEGASIALGGRPIGTTASGGDLRVDGLGNGPLDVRVDAENFRESQTSVTPTAGGTAVSVVLARPPGAVQVRVLGPDERPVPGATARFAGPDRLGPYTLGDSGDRTFVLRPGAWQALVSHPQYGVQQRPVLVDERDTALQRVRVVLRPPESGTANLVVRVLDPDGQAVDGAEVALDGEPIGNTSGGGLTLPGLALGPRTLTVSGENVVTTERPVDLHAGLQESLVVAPWRPGTVQIRASSPAGMVPDATARVAGPTRITRELGPDGTEIFPLDPGVYQALVTSPRWGAQQRGLSVAAGEGRIHRVDVVFSDDQPGAGKLAVEVRDPTGNPVSGARIQVDGQDLGATSTGGSASLEGLDPGRRTLTVTAPPYQRLERSVSVAAAGSTERVNLGWGVGAVRVAVTAQGRPVSDAVVRVGGPRFVPSTPVQSDGTRLFLLEPGAWQVLASSPALGATQVQLKVPATPQLTTLTVDLDPPKPEEAQVVVRVEDPDGAPVLAGTLRVDDGAPVPVVGGLAVLGDVTPGSRRLVSSAPNHQETVLEGVVLKQGVNERIVPMTFQPADLWVEVLGPGGRPVQAKVSFSGPDEIPERQTSADGKANLKLRPGTWKVLASAPDLGVRSAEVVLKPGEGRRNVQIRLAEAQVDVSAATVALKGTIPFDLGKSTLKAESKTLLDEVADTLLSRPDIVRVEVQGHTDPVGGVAENLTLSRDRAAAVVAALVARGVPPERLIARGYGPTRPRSDNTTEAGRAQNRRVEFVLETTEAPAP